MHCTTAFLTKHAVCNHHETNNSMKMDTAITAVSNSLTERIEEPAAAVEKQPPKLVVFAEHIPVTIWHLL